MELDKKAKEYAQEQCGSSYDRLTFGNEMTYGEVCEYDFKAGYNQGLEDSKAHEMLEMLKHNISYLKTIGNNVSINNEVQYIENLIRQTSEL